MPSAPSSTRPTHRTAEPEATPSGRSFTLLLDPFSATRPQTEAPPPEVSAELPLLPGFVLLREVGRGGMGVVYEALQLGVNRAVAVKMIVTGRFAAADDLLRFRLEAEMAARVRHPNVVQIHEVGLHDGLPYFVMEWVEGGTLGAYLRRARPSPADAARLVATLADAVHAAHLQGVVHRDLKPGNILMACGGRESAEAVPKIADFGLAKRLDRPAGLTAAGVAVGTPEYMAPEQARGLADGVGPAADVYALGAILYELLAGRPPLQGASDAETFLLLQSEDPQPIRRWTRAVVPADLETIALKCLRKAPADRYASAEALAADLRRFLRHRPIQARPVGRLERGRLWVRRNPLAATLLSLLVLLGAGGVTALAALYRQADKQRLLFAQQRDVAVANLRRAETAEAAEKARADEASALSGFLVAGVLKSMDPEHARARVVTMEDMLDFAVGKIDRAFASQPKQAATLRQAFSEAYFMLGRYAKARVQIEAALALREKLLGPDDIVTLETQILLARTLDEQGDNAAALKVNEACFARSLKVFGPSHETTCQAQNNLATCLSLNGRNAEGQKLLQDALAERERSLGPEHPLTLGTRGNLATLLMLTGKHLEATPLLEDVLRRRGATGLADNDNLRLMGNLAVCYDRAKRFEESNELVKRRIAALEERHGPKHPELVHCHNNLGFSYIRQNRPAEAEPLLKQGYALALETLGPNALLTATVQYNYAWSLQYLKRFDEAEKLFEENLALFRRIAAPDRDEVQFTLNRLAHLHEEAGDDTKARARYEELYASRRRRQGVTGATVTTLGDLVRVLLRQGDKEALLKVAEDAASAAAQLPPEAALDAATVHGLAGRVAARQGKLEFAEAQLRRALRIRSDKLRPDDPARLKSLAQLGHLLTQAGRFAEAEPLLLDAFARFETQPEGHAVYFREIRQSLVELYQKQGRAEDAAAWKAKKLPEAPAAGKPA